MDTMLNSLKIASSASELISNETYERLKRLISTGNALVFVGAGFSKDSINIIESTPPLAKDLALQISDKSANYLKEIGADSNYIEEIKQCDDLMVASDFFLNNIPRKDELLRLLKDNYTIKDVTQEQLDIFSMKWRRIYTTNYDNAIELSLIKSGKSVTPLTLEDVPNQYKSAEDICLHINGRIERSKENDLDSAIKLTTSSYLSPEQFLTSSWYRQFKTDIDNASAIVFLGYSMYDIDIQKIFFNDQSIKNKTFFITREGTTKFQNYKLAMFGEVINIGVNAFSHIAAKCIEESHQDKDVGFIDSLELYTPEEKCEEIRDNDVANFMVFGKVSDRYIDEVTLNDNMQDKIILREEISKIIEHIETASDILIASDLGNGKSIMTRILMSKLSRKGYLCFYYLFNEFSFSKDIERLSRLGQKIVIFIDDYSNCIDDTRYAIENRKDNIQLVLTTRHFGYENTKQHLLAMDMSNFKTHNIDYLSDSEVDNFVYIVDHLGGWGEKAGLSRREKLSELDENAKSQLSFLLLSILKSEAIQSRIKEISSFALNNKEFKETVFAILLLDVIGLPLVRSLISDVAVNEKIYSSEFIENEGVKNLFIISNGMVKTKSSTLSRFLIANVFENKYVVNQILKIVEHLNVINKDAKDNKLYTLITSLLRFSIIEKLLPQRRVEINYFYEKVKHIIPALINDPHFWVQYAMSMIPFKDYPSADRYLETAYSLAARRNNYHTKNIDTQRARLHLLVSLTKSGNEAFLEFEAGDNLIRIIPNDIYKYRQVHRYREVYEKVYPTFNAKQKVFYEYAVKRIIKESESPDLVEDLTYKIGVNWLDKLRENLKMIVENIQENRPKGKK
ncbi:SIR2 family protein [Klebsiella pasteurii]|uniref:SIR2 family protein n=1 Tax=Klebsiella pasteurii TaxID=2587529 RepID=A0ABD5HM04_9ENTR|nr:SIR2 family protein [Klebsiella pasteurii]MDW2719355.1 SIR2 family protein [Klebsiella pasteurii]